MLAGFGIDPRRAEDEVELGSERRRYGRQATSAEQFEAASDPGTDADVFHHFLGATVLHEELGPAIHSERTYLLDVRSVADSTLGNRLVEGERFIDELGRFNHHDRFYFLMRE